MAYGVLSALTNMEIESNAISEIRDNIVCALRKQFDDIQLDK